MLRATNRARFAGACLSLFVFTDLPAQGAELEVKRQDCLSLVRHLSDGAAAADEQWASESRAERLAPAGFGESGAAVQPNVYRVDIEIHLAGQDRVRRLEIRLAKVETAIALTKREIAAMDSTGQDSSAARLALADLDDERRLLLDSLPAFLRRVKDERDRSVDRLWVTAEGEVYLNAWPLQEPSDGMLARQCRAQLRHRP